MQYILEKKAKLVGRVDKGQLWLLNVHDDWIHDQYGESYIYHGQIYSSRNPFHPLSTSITGYFQDDDSQKWIKVKAGVATFNPENIDDSWVERVENLIKIRFKTGVYKYVKGSR
ncbi:molecular chaperone GrpE [Bacillus sp. AFS076308]|uniref:molecular chaperone GrpE n=1 Tax=unclassified Bacillus (in: firmicutes) TaxID=185979 RepID=UPI000BFA8746|nr:MULTISPECIES: molecular chaperone GrpE [unclassified Bacillus (in: firmicutes)]PFO07855.1 molecular chaperone GrpE [Bacillus sp. AFS076308]PGV49566.1 molecular chaperone GrpE [Bacillus sp. AFS037270]